MIIRVNNQVVQHPLPKYEGKEIIVAIDSSKRNSAFTVGDFNHRVLDYYEFNGTEDGTTELDTLKLCQVQRKALTQIFKGSMPKIVGIENIITKTNNGKETGISVHQSRFKITAVFMSFISFFQDNFDITPELVNNQTWKAAVLPETFRSREYHKGSLAYFKSIKSPYQYCSDDVTDSICIFEYLCKVHKITKSVKILEPEAARGHYDAVLVSPGRDSLKTPVLFEYNPQLTFQQNVIVMGNGISDKQSAITAVMTEWLSLDEIYAYCKGSFQDATPLLKLIVTRRT